MSAISGIRPWLYALCGVLLSLVYTLAVGLLTVQGIGLKDGAVLNLQNAVVGIAEPHVPYLQMLSVAFLGLLVAYVLFSGSHRRRQNERIALAAGFSLATAALLIYAFVGIQVSSPNVSIVEGSLSGWKGWVYTAAGDSSVHVLLALALGWMLLQILPAKSAAKRTNGAEAEISH